MKLKMIIIFTLLMTCAYLSIAFISLNIDIKEWNMFARTLLIVSFVINSIVAIIVSDDEHYVNY